MDVDYRSPTVPLRGLPSGDTRGRGSTFATDTSQPQAAYYHIALRGFRPFRPGPLCGTVLTVGSLHGLERGPAYRERGADVRSRSDIGKLLLANAAHNASVA